MSYDVSIIIVNYNGKKYIDNLFNSLYEMDTEGISFEIIFIDNDSSDKSIEYLKTKYLHKFEHLKIIKSDKNLGFSGGNNLGVQNSDGSYIVFLNNDTAVDKFWLKELYKCIISNNAGIVCSKLLFFYDFIKINVFTEDKIIFGRQIEINGQEYYIEAKFAFNMIINPNDVMCFGNSYFYVPLVNDVNDYLFKINSIQEIDDQSFFFINEKRYFINRSNDCLINIAKSECEEHRIALIQSAGSDINNNYEGFDIGYCQEDRGQFDGEKEVNSCCGAAMIIRKDTFINIGGFHKKFFMYYEDTDLSFRIKKQGKELIYCPKAVIRHIHTGSSKEWSPLFTFYVTRNRLLFIKRNIGLLIFIYSICRLSASLLKTVIYKREPLKSVLIKARAIISSFFIV